VSVTARRETERQRLRDARARLAAELLERYGSCTEVGRLMSCSPSTAWRLAKAAVERESVSR